MDASLGKSADLDDFGSQPAGGASTKEREARRVLAGMADRAFGAIDGMLLADQVLEVTDGGDWSVHLAAMDALRRRWRFAERDELRVASRPKGQAFGLYTTRSAGQKPRPYATQLLSLSPLRASCDCPDFPHNSLGLCKHVLVVLDDLYRRPRKLATARRNASLVPGGRARLRWMPVRPLTGAGDWLERVRLDLPGGRRGLSQREQRVAVHLEPDTATENATLRPRRRSLEVRRQRAEFVRELQRLAQYRSARGGLSDGGLESALVPLLRDERRKLEGGAAISRKELSGSLRRLKQKLYGYQRQGVERFLDQGKLLLADDMGLGKTAQAIACCHVLYQSGRVKRGLLIMPASLKAQWLREWTRFTDSPATIVDGSPSERRSLYRGTRKGFLIMNYEQLLRDLPSVQDFAPELVVLDEAQRIKNWATKTAMYVKQLSPAYRLVLTGTPMENRLEELASIMQWVDRTALEPAWRLAPLHMTEGGVQRLGTLRERLRPSLLRRVRQEVLDQLPSRTDTRVPVEMTREQMEEHVDLAQPIAKLSRIGQRRPLTQEEFFRLMSLLASQRMICNGLALAHFEETWPSLQSNKPPTQAMLKGLFSPKLNELRELLGNLVIAQKRKVVVFSQWRRMLQLAHWAVADLLNRAGLSAVLFTGSESQKRRTHNVINFHDDDATRVMFASDAGGVGLNLQRAASCCINLELPWNPAVLEQRVGRVYRLGQEQPVEVYNLVCEEGIEARIAGLVSNKRALAEGLFDGDSDEVLFDEASSFLERLERIIEPPALSAEASEDDAEDADVLTDAQLPSLSGEPSPAVEAADSQPSVTTAPNITAQLAELATNVRVQIAEDGELKLSAPPEVAPALAGFLESLASQLRRAEGPEAPRVEPGATE